MKSNRVPVPVLKRHGMHAEFLFCHTLRLSQVIDGEAAVMMVSFSTISLSVYSGSFPLTDTTFYFTSTPMHLETHNPRM